jgi:hypothetical protein
METAAVETTAVETTAVETAAMTAAATVTSRQHRHRRNSAQDNHQYEYVETSKQVLEVIHGNLIGSWMSDEFREFSHADGRIQILIFFRHSARSKEMCVLFAGFAGHPVERPACAGRLTFTDSRGIGKPRP